MYVYNESGRELLKFFSSKSKTIKTLAFFVFQTLLLGKSALSRFSTGRVIDLVSNDVQRMEEAAL